MTNQTPHYYTENRPWGNFIQFTKNEPSTVKLLSVNAGQSLSLQYHNSRTEYWYVVSGSGSAVIGSDTVELQSGIMCNVQPLQHHRITADSDLQIIEISFGNFEENDIVRISDNYGRVEE